MLSSAQVQDEIQRFCSEVDDNLNSETKISKFLEFLSSASAKTVEETQETTQRQLMITLLQIITAAPVQLAISACDKVLSYMKRITLMYDMMASPGDLLKKLNLKRLVTGKHNEVVYDLMIFILRYYSDVDYDDFDLGPQGKEILIREEKKRLNITLDHILVRQDKLQEDLKGHSVGAR